MQRYAQHRGYFSLRNSKTGSIFDVAHWLVVPVGSVGPHPNVIRVFENIDWKQSLERRIRTWLFVVLLFLLTRSLLPGSCDLTHYRVKPVFLRYDIYLSLYDKVACFVILWPNCLITIFEVDQFKLLAKSTQVAEVGVDHVEHVVAGNLSYSVMKQLLQVGWNADFLNLRCLDA